MKAVVAAFNQEKSLVGAFSVITNIRMELFEALLGAHICGFTGATLAATSHVRLARISGLDPAGPMFAR